MRICFRYTNDHYDETPEPDSVHQKNKITQVIVIRMLLHCQAYTSFHNLHDVVCYEAS
jgi:hypothetical protein